MSTTAFFEELLTLCDELSERMPKSEIQIKEYMERMKGFCQACLSPQGLDPRIREAIPIKNQGAFASSITWLLQNAALCYGQDRENGIRQHLGAVRQLITGNDMTRSQRDWMLCDVSQHDVLLPIASRKHFESDIAQALSEVGPDQPLSLLILDIDHFKHVNDTFGHPCGDEVLIAVAKTINKIVTYKGKAFRYGGEELTILLPNFTSVEAFALAERLRCKIKELSFSVPEMKVTVSIGIALFTYDLLNSNINIVDCADKALYAAKDNGRDMVCIYSEIDISNDGAIGLSRLKTGESIYSINDNDKANDSSALEAKVWAALHEYDSVNIDSICRFLRINNESERSQIISILGTLLQKGRIKKALGIGYFSVC